MNIKTNCAFCDNGLVRKTKSKTGMYFCNIECKRQWQLNQKPLNKEELYELYVIQRKSANEIADMVKRNPKRVWEWLKEYNIETRPRGTDYGQNFKKGDESKFKGHHHTMEIRNKIRGLRLKDGHVPYLINGVHWLKSTGRKPANFKGGVTPLRQNIYNSIEWKECVKYVWKKYNATCELCGLNYKDVDRRHVKFHIHHLYAFADYPELRTEKDNLILLCDKCHRFIHSNKNKENKFKLKNMKLPKWFEGECKNGK